MRTPEERREFTRLLQDEEAAARAEVSDLLLIVNHLWRHPKYDPKCRACRAINGVRR